MGDILNELINYTKFHFSNEERKMQIKNYSEFKLHKKEHYNLTEKVLDLQNKFNPAV